MGVNEWITDESLADAEVFLPSDELVNADELDDDFLTGTDPFIPIDEYPVDEYPALAVGSVISADAVDIDIIDPYLSAYIPSTTSTYVMQEKGFEEKVPLSASKDEIKFGNLNVEIGPGHKGGVQLANFVKVKDSEGRRGKLSISSEDMSDIKLYSSAHVVSSKINPILSSDTALAAASDTIKNQVRSVSKLSVKAVDVKLHNNSGTEISASAALNIMKVFNNNKGKYTDKVGQTYKITASQLVPLGGDTTLDLSATKKLINVDSVKGHANHLDKSYESISAEIKNRNSSVIVTHKESKSNSGMDPNLSVDSIACNLEADNLNFIVALKESYEKKSNIEETNLTVKMEYTF